jgi:hypothetical protein
LNSALLALAMLAQPETLAGKIQMQRIARAIVPVARKHQLDPTLLAAIAIAESGGRNLVARRRGRGRRGADVGVFQIHCPKARPACIRRYRDISTGAAEAAQILQQGRRLCRSPRPAYRKICKRGFWARYNPGSVRWTKRVRSLWARIRARVRPHVPPGV